MSKFSVKFIYSEKSKKCEISTLDLSHVVPFKSTVETSQNFVAFSEYVYFNKIGRPLISYDKRSDTCDNYLPLEELSSVSTRGSLLYSSYLQNKVSLGLFWKVLS